LKPFVAIRAYAKVNLGLRVLGLRPDSFHGLHTHMQTIELADELRFARTARAGLCLQTSPSLNVPQEQNLVTRAMKLFVERTGCARGVSCQLRKRIPVGAGLGGGSSDAAATLRALDRLFETRLDLPTLVDWAQELGSDVPFFLHGGYACVQGRGERITPLASPYLRAHFVVVVPPVLASTPEVFRAWDALHPGQKTATATPHCCSGLTASNELETPACARYPALRKYATLVRAAPTPLRGMSGSGSAWYAAFFERGAALNYVDELRSQQPKATVFLAAARCSFLDPFDGSGYDVGQRGESP